MKHGALAISALLIIGLLAVPMLSPAQQIARPIDKSVFPGVTTISYANQTLVFTTPVALRVKLEVLASGKIQLRFKAQTGRTIGQQSAAMGQTVIFWQEAAEDLYSGPPPEDWTDVPFGEGGWTEK